VKGFALMVMDRQGLEVRKPGPEALYLLAALVAP